MSIKSLIRFLIALLLLSPFLVLVSELNSWNHIPYAQFLHILSFTILQASLSSFSILLFGFLGALGLVHFYNWKKLETLLLLPSLVPTLFVLVACLKFFNPFPFGLTGIVIVQTALYTGLCAVSLKSLLLTKVGTWSELALVEGATRLAFLKVVLSYLKKDLALLLLFFFSLTFSSLSVPLIAGGFTGQTLELFIYEKIRIDQDFSQAFALSLFQSLFLLAICWKLSRFHTSLNTKPFQPRLLGLWWGLIPVLTITVIILWGQLLDLPRGFQDLKQLHSVVSFSSALLHSVFISLGAGFFMIFLLALTCYALPHPHFRPFLLSYLAPSTAFLGVAWLSLDLPEFLSPLVAIILGLCVLTLPLIYRLQVDGTFYALLPQMEVAQSLGASPSEIYWKIILPQVWPALCFGAALMAFWASGDFAFSSLMAPSTFSLSLLIKSLADSYRIEAASSLAWLNLILGLSVWIFFRRLGYVFGYRPH